MNNLKNILFLGIIMSSYGFASSWYTFTPDNKFGPNAIGLEDWNENEAGAKGRITSKNDKLYYDGAEIKLWGINNTYSACAPDKNMADRRANFYRKMGINTVRLHKYADGPAWAGIQSDESFVEFDAKKLDQMDYFIATLKKNGIYTKLSPTFGIQFGPGDTHRIPYWDEIGKFSGKKKRIRMPHGGVYLARECQDMQIEQTVNVLEHRNPYTGMRYADDPAICIVEMFNEDAVLFYGTNTCLETIPTLRKRTAKRFSAWLKNKYGNDDGLHKAWGNRAFDLKGLVKDGVIEKLPRESLVDKTVVPFGNPWFFENAVRGDEKQRFRSQRMLDTMEFLTLLQDEFYERFLEAIRKTGYTGEVMASNWQSGNGISHFYNVYSDYKIGMIDRHNYTSGPKTTTYKKSGPVNTVTMLADPGSDMLSSGLQQVANRPFMLSEWIHEQPHEFTAEGPAIIGAYGMGLNGWDVSYMFENNDKGGFSNRLGIHPWDVTIPQVVGVFPAISRMVRRMDLNESDLVIPINVHPASFPEGKLGVHDFIQQKHDVKSFDSKEVPNDALAVGRVAIHFTATYKQTPNFDFGPYKDGNTLVSSTHQLRWTPAEDNSPKGGFFTIDTPSTKGFVGFAPGNKTFDLTGISITPEKGFCSIYVTAKGKNKTLANADEWILVAIGRARNTGMEFNEQENKLLKMGKGPIQLESIKAQLEFAGNMKTLTLLDHDGRLTDNTKSFHHGRLAIDGDQDQTPYYLISK